MCRALITSHPRAAASTTIVATAVPVDDAAKYDARYKMPSQSEFPRFTDARARSHGVSADPLIFFQLFNRACEKLGVPLSRRVGAFIGALSDATQIEYVEKTLVPKKLTWDALQLAFTKRFTDKLLIDKLKTALEDCTQKASQSAAGYASDFQQLVTRLEYDPKSRPIIDQMERGFNAAIVEHLKQGRASAKTLYECLQPDTAVNDSTPLVSSVRLFARSQPFISLESLSDAAVEAEASLANSVSTRHSTQTRGRHPRSAVTHAATAGMEKLKHVNDRTPPRKGNNHRNRKPKVAAVAPAPAESAKASKLEMTQRGPAHAGSRRQPAKGGSGAKSNSYSRGRNTRGGPAGGSQSATGRPMKCFNCQAEGHSQVECKKNMDCCRLCKGKGHMFAQCSLYRPPTAKALTAAAVHVDSSPLTLTCTRLGSAPLFNVLVDSGAQFSTISKRLVTQFHLPVSAIPASEVRSLGGAATSMQVPRIGTVTLAVTAHYPSGNDNAAVSFTKKFEIMDTEEDVLLGMEMWPVLFPRSTDVLACLGSPSSITSAPTQVRYHKASRVYRIRSNDSVVTGTASSPSLSTHHGSNSVDAELLDEWIDECNLYEIGAADFTSDDLEAAFDRPSVRQVSAQQASTSSKDEMPEDSDSHSE
jgi:hypothetical protein